MFCFCVKERDVLVIPAGAVIYSANTHDSKSFRVVMLLNPVSTKLRGVSRLSCMRRLSSASCAFGLIAERAEIF
jgi:hypothetical protein